MSGSLDTMAAMQPQFVYGPVPSRRLGRSLGVDIIPFKTCTYDCVYCQLGRTTCHTSRRSEYVPTGLVLDEVLRTVEDGLEADYITIAGSGEPTLHSGLADIIRGIKRKTDIPVAVITNGSLMWQNDVAAALRMADLVIPSLDASDPDLFAYINRPCPGIGFDTMLRGMQQFRTGFENRLWLEIFLLNGINDFPGTVHHLAECAATIGADMVQLNTAVRPAAEDYACPVGEGALRDLAELFTVPVTVIGTCQSDSGVAVRGSEESILALLARRPCTINDITQGLRMHHNDAVKYLGVFTDRGTVKTFRRDGSLFYTCAGPEDRKVHGD